MNREEVKDVILAHFAPLLEDGLGIYDKKLEVQFLEPAANRPKKGLGLCITFSKMYRFDREAPFNFDDLAYLSNLLGTRDINIGSENYREGCETCDYGSRASISVFCSNITAIS